MCRQYRSASARRVSRQRTGRAARARPCPCDRGDRSSTARQLWRLVGFDIQLLHQPPILLVIIANEPRKLRLTSADGLLCSLQEALPDCRDGERLVDLGIEAGDDRLRCPGGHKDTEPLIE